MAWHYPRNKMKHILVAEFPRSGGTWLCQMLSYCSGIPFPRNENLNSKQSSILHGHYPFQKHFEKPVYILRDGRDVMVSAYFYFLLNTENPEYLIHKWRKLMAVDEVEHVSTHLPRFIDIFHQKFQVAGKKIWWSKHVEGFQNERVLGIKYEDLHCSGPEMLKKVLNWLQIEYNSDLIRKAFEKFSFETQTGRKKGIQASDKFLRKGVVGDWKNYFNAESAEVFNFYAGNVLIQTGYAKDKNWHHQT
jgi:hypothetical protein